MSHLFPGVLSALKPGGRGARIRLIIVETHEGLPKVKSGDLDLLIAYRYLPEGPPTTSGEWTITSLGHEPLVLVTGPRSGGRPLKLAECLEMEWTSGHAHSPDRRVLHRWAGELGASPDVTLETEDLHSMLAMIRAGLAVGLIPATLISAESERPGVERVVLPPEVAPLHREVLAVSRAGIRPPVVNELAAASANRRTAVVPVPVAPLRRRTRPPSDRPANNAVTSSCSCSRPTRGVPPAHTCALTLCPPRGPLRPATGVSTRRGVSRRTIRAARRVAPAGICLTQALVDDSSGTPDTDKDN